MDKLSITKKSFKEKYKQITEVGSGTYGYILTTSIILTENRKVYKVAALDNDSNDTKYWAFKKITYSKDNEGVNNFPQTALREIKILKSLDHENVIKLHDIITSKPSENNKYKGSTFLIFDYMDHDLWGLLKMNIQFNIAQLKCMMQQLLRGVEYIHAQNIIHRDLKSANILLNNKGEVKIADFGLARNLNSLSGHYTSFVVTLWYRAPELLLGSKKYTTQVDIWSIGCIMAELILGAPLFPGDKEPKQCELIFQTCGTPNDSNWPGCRNLPYYNTFVPSDITEHHERSLKSYLLKQRPFLNSTALDFIDKLLILNPEKRMTAKEALEHEFFHTEPLPCELHELPKLPQECHITLMNMEKKKRDQKKIEEESLNRKRKFHELDNRKNKNPEPTAYQTIEKAYPFRSPGDSEIPTTLPKTQNYTFTSAEQRIETHAFIPAEPEGPKPFERMSGISNLFSHSSDKKSHKEEPDLLSSLLHSNYKKKGSPTGQGERNDNKKLHI